MGFGGPHAAFFAVKEDFKRSIPGRIIGISVDVKGGAALRMALQTREQHIRREKATSNICTAQALLANMAGMYAVYHGPEGLQSIAGHIHHCAGTLHATLKASGIDPVNSTYFDAITIQCSPEVLKAIRSGALKRKYNLYYEGAYVHIAFDETHTVKQALEVAGVIITAFGKSLNKGQVTTGIPGTCRRQSTFLTHEVFHSIRTETELMRYCKRLENKDISLMHSMIPLGSCTMKLNAASEMIPLTWPQWSLIHPFAPVDQVGGYLQIIRELEQYLCTITGFDACSLQPNSGAQGEYAGLIAIRDYHIANKGGHRNVALIPSSAHGTNPASAVMAGLEVIVVACDEKGNIDIHDLQKKADQYKDRLSCLMVTYPSTHGVFEDTIIQVCEIIHAYGGLVYMDGANMNAQVGLTSPRIIGADVCHLNLHKTFAIPHGGGGPGMGPICVVEKLSQYLPGHVVQPVPGKTAHAVSAAPWGSASILLISYAYIRMLGAQGVTDATKYAILNANYIAGRLKGAYDVLYTGDKGRVAHELILDLRPFKAVVSAEDVAKRLIDYGFHAPTLSFPVAGTIMIEPTESESKAELDRFCDAMLQIRTEIQNIINGTSDKDDNPLHNAPHTLAEVTASEWKHSYSREEAAWPLAYLKGGYKFWPSVARVNNAFGDRNLVCTCMPTEFYAQLGEK
jgi:glycine dehydrogenase